MKKSILKSALRSITIFFFLIFINCNANALGIFETVSVSKANTIVIMYHQLSENPDKWSNYCTSPKNFENDIIYLKKSGYKFLTSNELASYIPSPFEKIAVITFDDGYMSDLKYALPIIEKHGAKATFFVTGKNVGTPDYLDEASLKKLSDSTSVEIGNHSYALHINTDEDLKKMYAQKEKCNEICNDFFANIKYLEGVTGKKIVSLSYPNGIYSVDVNNFLLKNGVKITFSTGATKYRGISPVGRLNRAHSVSVQDLLKVKLS